MNLYTANEIKPYYSALRGISNSLETYFLMSNKFVHCNTFFQMRKCNNYCFTVHRGTTDPLKNCIELNSQPVGLERINKTIYVGTMDESLHCYTSKVRHLFLYSGFLSPLA